MRPALPEELSRFQCHRCGNCCRGDGFVDMRPADIRRAAAYLDMEEADFLARFAKRQPDGKWFLIDQGDPDKSCVFLTEENLCRINPAKPQQCADFPERWRPRDLLEFCAGMRAAAGLPPPQRKTITDREES